MKHTSKMKNNIKDSFSKQLKGNEIVTEEIFKKIKTKEYHSGRKVKIGDRMLFAFLNDDVNIEPVEYLDEPLSKDIETPEIKITLIIIHEDEIDNYVLNENRKISGIPEDVPIVSIKK